MSQPLLVASAFGVRDFPRILSVHQLAMNGGVALGPVAIGLMYDFGGGYGNAFVFVEEICILRLTEVLAYVLLSLVKLLVLLGGWVLSLALKELLKDVESLDSLLLLQLVLFVGFVLV